MADLLSSLEDKVLTLTINRPQSHNTVTYNVLDGLLDAFAEADANPCVRVIIVTGAGEAFSYGTDLSTGGGGFDTDAAGFKPLRGGHRDTGGELALRIFNSTKPVIAAVNGTAVGIGVTMILPMDIRVAADSARFALPFARRGIVAESCASWFLPRIVGIATAVDWAVTGRRFDAQEALARGLVSELRPADQVLARAQQLAAEIAAQTSAVSVALTRQMLWRQLGSPHPMSANRLESQALLALGAMADAKEGVAAFKQKRPPSFALNVPGDLPDFYPWFGEEPFDER
ncbi:enoyl-CoA hydratase-related protein [Mycobacterium branderi]|uniref:Enoyl-CoA hydratase n=1 Tax=Mycobacterium branderi TaxID=43348 RepID=A0A7I7WG26_9MYCO|nr:enoyl-CoA hydratase-related protein [Mycobacterium branderi]MCV7231599.1 enoyl-CoA hydratase/isomerase family protein [Mycobacterium branderi]ORA40407.1 enoyl-CoA hydratase [Mycobacterium branderi]BBZ14918.1 enoyl-CoA hydratase [Mycobacterium branderi]